MALVGENGSGKTTLVKLLAGLYTPERGRILWDGVDAGERGPAATRRTYRDGGAGLQTLAVHGPRQRGGRSRLGAADGGACHLVGGGGRGRGRGRGPAARPGDALLARGFSGGHELSGGQWQRLGIARAAYRRGLVFLIVDEPTAALDARAELEVFDKIRALAGSGQTVVLITHRLASVRHADLVHVLEQGHLVESGSPERTAAKGGVYAELYSLQAEQFTTKVPTKIPTKAPRKAPAPKVG